MPKKRATKRRAAVKPPIISVNGKEVKVSRKMVGKAAGLRSAADAVMNSLTWSTVPADEDEAVRLYWSTVHDNLKILARYLQERERAEEQAKEAREAEAARKVLARARQARYRGKWKKLDGDEIALARLLLEHQKGPE